MEVGHTLMTMLFLILLIAQTVGYAMTTRYSRLLPGPPYVGTTCVVCSECVKVLLSFSLVIIDSWANGPCKTMRRLFLEDWRSFLLMGIPGLLYTFQNNLLLIGIENLSVTLYQVTNQTKILSTAVLSVAILGKRLTLDKWFALVLLTAGVMLTVAKGDESSKGVMALGLVAVGISACTSGFAGVFLEKMLKDSEATIWERNSQLSLYGVAFGLLAVFLNDGEKVRSQGFFQGYNEWVLLVILLQAVGGLVVACVLKYADNILKCFAVAISMILGAVCSRLVYKEGPELTDPLFVSGTALVLLATVLYSLGMEGICAKCWQNASPPADSTVDELEDDQDIELGKAQIAHSKASAAGSRVLNWLTFGTKTQTEHDFFEVEEVFTISEVF
jgi:UDP-sugar transporter A1/2/3